MENRKFSLEVIESNRITKVSETIFGLLCLSGALWFAISLRNQLSNTLSGWLAVAFLALFGIWEILSGAGLVSRYIIFGTDNIIIRDKFWKTPAEVVPSELAEVRFKPLTVDFCLKGDRVISVRLGTYYSERSAEIMESVKKFCSENDIKVSGEGAQQENGTL